MYQDPGKDNVIQLAGKRQAQTGRFTASSAQPSQRHVWEAEDKAQQVVGDAKSLGNGAIKKPLIWVWRRQV